MVSRAIRSFNCRPHFCLKGLLQSRKMREGYLSKRIKTISKYKLYIISNWPLRRLKEFYTYMAWTLLVKIFSDNKDLNLLL